MKIRIAFITAALLTACVQLSMAQQELGTHFMTNTIQATRTNPAFAPDANIVIGLPGIYNNFFLTNVTYSDVFVEDGDRKLIDINNTIDQLDPVNYFKEYLDFDVLSANVRLNALHLFLGYSVHFQGYGKFPKTLVQYAWQGNSQFIGTPVDIALENQFTGYHEFALGAGWNFGDFLKVGGRVKVLSGIANLSVDQDRNRLIATTSDDVYQLTLDTDYQVHLTGDLEYNGIRDITYNFGFDDLSFDKLYTPNLGFAFDLGAQLSLGPFDINASVIDLGQISWREGANNLGIRGVDTFEGIDALNDFLRDSSSFGNIIDTLEASFEIIETDEAFTTPIPTSYYLSGVFHLNSTFRFGGLFYMEQFRGEVFPAAGLSAQARVGKWFEAGILYAWRQDALDDLGVNATLNLGPVQLFFATDTFISFFRPTNTSSVNFRGGLNLQFQRQFTTHRNNPDTPDSFF